MVIDRDRYFIYVGSAHDGIARITQDHLDDPTAHTSVQTIMNSGAQSLYFPKQTHSNRGHRVTAYGSHQSFSVEGDYVITNTKALAIGVLTADCMPLVLYDPVAHACAIIHAGWRGVASAIVSRAIDHMRIEYQSDPQTLECFIGPCARVCCYSVGADVQNAFARNDCFVIKNETIYCDLVAAVGAELSECGVSTASLVVDSACTIDDHRYFSYRRQRENAGRQMTLVCLR